MNGLIKVMPLFELLKQVSVPQQPRFPAEDHDSVALVLASYGEEAAVSAEANLHVDDSRKTRIGL